MQLLPGKHDVRREEEGEMVGQGLPWSNQLEAQRLGAEMVESAAQLTQSESEEHGEWNLRKREIKSNHHRETSLLGKGHF